MVEGKIVYAAPKPVELPPIAEHTVGSIYLDEHGQYWELSGWLDSIDEKPTRPASWTRMHKARVRLLKRRGVIPK